MVPTVGSIFVVAKIIKTTETTKGTCLEWQIVPVSITKKFSVLMGFGWLLMTNVIPGVALPICSHHWIPWCYPFSWFHLPHLPSNHLFHHYCTSKSPSSIPNGRKSSAPVLNITALVPGGDSWKQRSHSRLQFQGYSRFLYFQMSTPAGALKEALWLNL